MDEFENKVKELFCNSMETDACDLAECIFTSVEEKRNFIQNSWNDYGDDIVAFVWGTEAMMNSLRCLDLFKKQLLLKQLKRTLKVFLINLLMNKKQFRVV